MENNSFMKEYAEYYDLFNKDKSYEKEVNFLEETFKKYYYKGVKTILDLGCGTGIHDRLLSLRGYNIFGLDLSEDMIKLAKLRDMPNSEFKMGNMSNFNLEKKFDSCICMFAAFGYLPENKQIESCLNSIKRHLNPGGLFIMDCWNGLGVINERPIIRTKEAKSGDFKIVRKSFPKLNAFKHVCDIKFIVDIFKNDSLIKTFEEIHKMRFFFPQELRKYLEDAGFEVLEICKTFELGQTVDENDWNMAVISRLKD